MKKIFLIFLSFTIYFNSFTNAHAQAVGGWTVNNIAAQGAKAVVSASQNVMINGKEYIKKGTALVAPTASQVSKVLARGAAGYALSVAVEQLLGAVDWVLDSANNQIKYYPPNSDPADPTYQWRWNGVLYNSPQDACSAFWSTRDGWKFVSVSEPTRQFPGCVGYNKEQDRYDVYTPVERVARTEAVEDEEQKTLPLDVVAAQVISNAEGGNTDAQTATVAAAQDIVNDAEKDDAKAAPLVNQFEDSATTENANAAEQDAANDATGNTKPNEAGGTDIALEFPAFCGWAPTVCQAAQVVISFPQKLENWYKESTKSISEAWTAVKDWAKTENKNNEENTDVQTIDENLPNINTGLFKASGSCPPDFQYAFPLPFGGTHTISYSYETACTWFSKLYFVVVTCGWISAYFIVMGIRKNE